MNIILMMANILKLIISEKRQFDKCGKKYIGLPPEKKYQLIKTQCRCLKHDSSPLFSRAL
jgi:hypothetical protein